MWPSRPQVVVIPEENRAKCCVFGCGAQASVLRITTQHNHIGLYCEAGHWQKRWIAHSEFLPTGSFAGLLPAEWFDPKPGRPKKDAIRDKIRYQALLDTDNACAVCARRAPSQPRSAAYLRSWLQAYHPQVHRDVARHYEELRSSGIGITFENWLDFMPPNIRRAVADAVDRSRLEADHVIPVRILREIRNVIEKKIGKAAYAFLINECCLPLCRSCNAGRPRTGIEARGVLEDRYIRFKYDGNRRLASASREFDWLRQGLLYAEAYVQSSRLEGA